MVSNSLSMEHICAVFVTYHPDIDFPGRVAVIKQQVACVVIVDNGSDPLAVDMLRYISSGSNIHLILNHDNRGIATALNQGVRYAKSRGYSWALTLDQDTVADDKMVGTLLGVHGNLEKKERIAVLGSRYRIEDGEYPPLDEKDDRYDWVDRKDVITSGSLMSMAAFDVIGPFRDRFFIDHVDTEYCLRARSRGFKIILARTPLMQHSIGEGSTHLLLRKRTGTTNHSPLRRYYNTRNLFVLVREYLFREPIWTFSALYSWAKSIVLICLFEQERLVKLKSIVAGVVHGFTFRLDDH